MKFENEYFNGIPAPMRIVFPTGPVGEAELHDERWEKARRRTYRLDKYLETDGEIWLGKTRLGRGRVNTDYEVILKPDPTVEPTGSFEVQLTVDFGRTAIRAGASLVPGDIIALDRPSDLPVCVRFAGVSEGWATGELVLVDDDLSVRIGTIDRCVPDTPDSMEGKIVSVPLGSFTFDTSALDSIGEGTIIPLGHAITVPFTLFSNGTALAEGRIRAVLPRDATVPQARPDGTHPDPARPLSAFVVTRVLESIGDTPTPDNGKTVGQHGGTEAPRYDAVFAATPEPVLDNFVLTGEPCIAGLVVQLIGNNAAGDAARLLEKLLAQGSVETIRAFSECDSARVDPLVLREIVAPLYAALPPEDQEHARTLEEAFDTPSRLEAEQLVPVVLSAMSETEAKAVIATVEEVDPDRAQSFRNNVLFFEDIGHLDDRALQKLLREVDTGTLAHALSGAGEEVQRRITENMSKRGASIFADEMRYAGSVPPSVSEDAREAVLRILGKLIEYGEIVL